MINFLFFALLLIATGAYGYDSGPHTPAEVGGTLDTMSVTGAGSGVYGDLDGYKRVLALEVELDAMAVGNHPRLYLTPTLIAELVLREQQNSAEWQAVKTRADASTANIPDNAIVALTCANDATNYPGGWGNATVQSYVDRVITGIAAGTSTVWPTNQYVTGNPYRYVAVWALGFDWVYDGLTSGERETIIDKIRSYVDFQATKAWWDVPTNELAIRGETFHREGWAFDSWKQYPELAVAGHNTTTYPTVGDEALALAKRRWAYDTEYGDALRFLVYDNSGTAMEGYQHGAVGIGWFLPLETAFGIDAFSDYIKATANTDLYLLDLTTGEHRIVFHYGVSGSTGGIYALNTVAPNPWRRRDYIMRGWSYNNDDPYNQWALENVPQYGTNLGSVSWMFSQVDGGYNRWADLEPISDLIWYDTVNKTATDPIGASYANLPTGRVFGHSRFISRTGWGDDSPIFEMAARPATTRLSHGFFDAASWQFYRDGNLSAASGTYDAGISGWDQGLYRSYTATTLASNSILIVDPDNPGLPATTVGATPENFGGSEGSTMRTFQNTYSQAPSANASKLGVILAHSAYSDEARIIGSDLNEVWDWVAADTTVAYKERAVEVTRQALTIKRADGNMYAIIFDRVETNLAKFIKKFIQHSADNPSTLPTVVGATTGTEVEVADHIINYDANGVLRISSKNPNETYSLHTWNVLPVTKNLRIVGGRGTEANCNTDGYDFYKEGAIPVNDEFDWWVNSPVSSCIGGTQEIISYITQWSGVSIDNIGTWRTEVKSQVPSLREYFLTVMYTAEPTDAIPVVVASGDNGVVITEGSDIITLAFNRTGNLGGTIVMTGSQTINDSFSLEFTSNPDTDPGPTPDPTPGTSSFLGSGTTTFSGGGSTMFSN